LTGDIVVNGKDLYFHFPHYMSNSFDLNELPATPGLPDAKSPVVEVELGIRETAKLIKKKLRNS